jgi:hypothetical protein
MVSPDISALIPLPLTMIMLDSGSDAAGNVEGGAKMVLAVCPVWPFR